jgi:hypothetical protein
MTEKDE